MWMLPGILSEFLLGAAQKPYNTNLLEHREEDTRAAASGCCLGKLDLWLVSVATGSPGTTG